MIIHRHSLNAVAVITLALIPAASLAVTYRTTGSVNTTVANYSSSPDSYDRSGYTTTAGEALINNFGPDQPSFHAQANSQADPLGLHAHAYSGITKEFQGGGNFYYDQSATSFAQATYTDVIITGPIGSGPVSVSFNVHLDGSDITETSLSQNSSTLAASTVQIGFFALDQNIGGGSHSDSTREGIRQTPSSTGSLSSFTGNNVITSPTFLAPVNTPFSITLQLSAFAGVEAYFNDSFVIAANTDYGDTLTFATNQPVFNLPAGYSADSPDAGIVNNTFVLPEPASLSLLLFPLTFFASRRRTK